ncbi:2-hydroxyacid dehydrogenase [Piscinibacter terrae]|uniref:Glyoxylate/hydroxypyruvate reductase A n=1 Tax=Piscinibacter terrae TaxID=2496871 RepID=A0A3N7HJW7_9BURK|nr:glyoxylate/hydroxypyruvate reductase A [Albitalea terrae]RQP22364.1 glyoxylate/hydroxypyruvate reductase A [Albitalea terrae]
MAILLVADLPADEHDLWLRCLREAMPGETIVADRSLADAAAIDVAVVAKPPPGSLTGLPNLRFIQSLWAGVDRLLQDHSIDPAVPLARMVDPAMNIAMAETAQWAVLGLHRRFFDYQAQQREARWLQHDQLRADEVQVAVLGQGQMGSTVADRLRALGYAVEGWSRRSGMPALAGLLARSDIVINLMPLTGETHHFFNRDRFAQMKRRSALVNLGRGGHVADGDLLQALADGQLSRAVLDVFHVEPLASDHAFWAHPHITVLPHIAAWTDARSASAAVASNVARLRAGLAPEHLVDRSRGY